MNMVVLLAFRGYTGMISRGGIKAPGYSPRTHAVVSTSMARSTNWFAVSAGDACSESGVSCSVRLSLLPLPILAPWVFRRQNGQTDLSSPHLEGLRLRR
jgi:hypothetical protein